MSNIISFSSTILWCDNTYLFYPTDSSEPTVRNADSNHLFRKKKGDCYSRSKSLKFEYFLSVKQVVLWPG